MESPPQGNVARLRTGDAQGPGYRQPPHNLEAEMGILGALLANNAAYHKVSEILRPDHFANAVHARIYEAIQRLMDRGQVANPVTLRHYFEQDGSLAAVGGVGYLVQLAAAATAIVNARQYGEMIVDLSTRRRLIEVGEDLVNESHAPDPKEDAASVLERAEHKLFTLADAGMTERGFTSLRTATLAAIATAETAFQRDSHVTGVTTGFMSLDRKLGGLHPSDLVILAGRPSMGKTALATNMAYLAAEAFLTRPDQGAKVAFFSLEMSAEQLALRILAEQAGIPSDKIRRGEVRQDDFPLFVEVSQRLSQIPLFIDDTPAMTVPALRTRARRLKRTEGLDFIVIDYLQLLRGVGSGSGGPENRVQEISEITRGLKALAKELQVPVLALSQLSRAVEQREDKRPQLADLRESGSIEQDADVVMFIFREQYYLERSEPQQKPEETVERFAERHDRWKQRAEAVHNTAEVAIAKQRHGPIG
ncbi:MAG: replicative DNA helicase, partial [Alphaproteobacteria bacterium]|nr:replicative DNA helicase [Alphaproteobacteria bacterium]